MREAGGFTPPLLSYAAFRDKSLMCPGLFPLDLTFGLPLPPPNTGERGAPHHPADTPVFPPYDGVLFPRA